MSGAVTCSVTGCSRPATVIYRMRPRRDRDPLCREIQQATAWPGQSQPCSVPACGPCSGKVRDSAIVVLDVTHVEEAVAVVAEGEGETG
jgi:hypothetical protein